MGERKDGKETPPEGVPKALRPAGQRITLELPAVPLSLPGESPLALPDGVLIESKRGPLAVSPAHDGWAPEASSVGVSRVDPAAAEGGAGRAPTPSDASEAMGLVDRVAVLPAAPDLETEAKERFELGDFTGALRAAELLLGQHPDHPSARGLVAASRERLLQLYASRIGPLDQIVSVGVRDAGMRWLGLDHRAGFLLSCVDGASTVEELIDISAMPRLEALKTLVELLDSNVIAVRPKR